MDKPKKGGVGTGRENKQTKRKLFAHPNPKEWKFAAKHSFEAPTHPARTPRSYRKPQAAQGQPVRSVTLQPAQSKSDVKHCANSGYEVIAKAEQKEGFAAKLLTWKREVRQAPTLRPGSCRCSCVHALWRSLRLVHGEIWLERCSEGNNLPDL